jgi:phenylalanyl-tRNA synthetase beta chain
MDNTKRIVIESANFEPFCIRKTSEQFALRTEASIRYEKSLDPLLTEVALRRAVELILEVCPDAKVASTVVDEFPAKPSAKTIETTFSFLRARIGEALDNKYIKDVLTRLGFELKAKGDNL